MIEIINGPFDVYLAPVGEAYPDISEAPAGNWEKVGVNASRHYNEEGVKFGSEQDIEERYGAGGTEVLKISRIRERAKVTFTLFDLSSGEYVKAFNLANTTTDTAPGSGAGGHQSFGILRGLAVTSNALLVRGENLSPDMITENKQIEMPAVVQVANLEIVFTKGGEAGLLFDLQAVADYTYESGAFPYGRILIGDDPAI